MYLTGFVLMYWLSIYGIRFVLIRIHRWILIFFFSSLPLFLLLFLVVWVFFGLFWFWFFLPVRDHGKDVFYCYFLFSEPRVINVLLDRTSCPFQHNTLSFSSWKYRSRYLFQTFFKWVSNIREILPDLSPLFNVLGWFFFFFFLPLLCFVLGNPFPTLFLH